MALTRRLRDSVVVITGASGGIGVGGVARLLGIQWRLAPGPTERLLGGYAARTEFGSGSAPPTSGNVFRAGPDEMRVEGGWRGRARMALRTTAALGVAAAGTAVVLARRYARRRPISA